MKYIRCDVNKYEFMTHRSLAGSGAGPLAMGFRWGPSPIKSNKVEVVARERGENPGAATSGGCPVPVERYASLLVGKKFGGWAADLPRL
jgi:hypothetical protein